MKTKRTLSDGHCRGLAVELLDKVAMGQYSEHVAQLENPQDLAEYLADCIEHEQENNSDLTLQETITEGIDAYESIFEGGWVFTDVN